MKFILAILLAANTAFAISQTIVKADIVEGQATSKNFLKEKGHFEKNATGFVAYADAAGTSPVDGTGGSPSVTCTRSTSSPLTGDGSGLITKGASNRQGDGCGINFSIDSKDQAKVLQISFSYLVNSGTFVAGTNTTDSDVTVWIYDVTNATIIQPSSYRLLSNNGTLADVFNATFQTAANGTSYRLIFHVGSTSASAYSLKLDDIKVSPSTYVYGTPITAWQSYTPTFTGFGTVTGSEFQYRRVGDSYEVFGSFVSGTPTATEARVSFPGTSDATKILSLKVAGQLFSGGAFAGSWSVLVEGNVGYFTFGIQGGSNAGYSKVAASTGFASSTAYSFRATVPVAGFGSVTQTSDQNDSRVVSMYATYQAGTGTINTSYNVVKLLTVTKDTHSAYNSTTGLYTVPVAGYYQITGGTDILAAYTQGATVSAQVGNTTTSDFHYGFTRAYTTTSIDFTVIATGIVYAKAGDQLGLYSACSSSSPSYSTGLAGSFLSIQRVSGPSAISASETIAAYYYLTANTSFGTTTPINYDAKVYDTHGAVTTGASWKFTAPISGFYRIDTQNDVSGATLTFFNLQKNGSTIVSHLSQSDSVDNGYGGSGSVLIQLLAGDYIDIRPGATLTIRGGTQTGSNTARIMIQKVGQ